MILRDLELLRKIDEKAVLTPNLKGNSQQGMIVTFSFSTVDPVLAGIFEPGASTVEERLETMKKFSDEGFLVGANLMPVLLFLSDSEEQLDEMIGKVKEFGGGFVLVAGLTLFGDEPSDCKVRYYKALEKHFPDVISQTRKLFGNSFALSQKYQYQLWKLSEKLAKKHGIRTKIRE